jgi:hypothetical protein
MQLRSIGIRGRTSVLVGDRSGVGIVLRGMRPLT